MDDKKKKSFLKGGGISKRYIAHYWSHFYSSQKSERYYIM